MMDTSDSEHFESADEYQSDCENSDTKVKSVADDVESSEKQRLLNNLNISEHCENISTKNGQRSEVNNSPICRDNEANRTGELNLKNDSDTSQNRKKGFLKKINNFDSLAERQLDIDEKHDFSEQNTIQKQREDSRSKVLPRTQGISDFDVTKKHVIDSSKLEAIDQIQESECENMWDEEEWVPISIDNVNCEVEKDTKFISSSSNTNEDLKNIDDWEPTVEKKNESEEGEIDKIIPSQIRDTNNENSWSDWGTWGVSSILSTATYGVSTITNQVSQGLSVLESSMGIPDPEELAKQHSKEEEKICEMLESTEQHNVEENSIHKHYSRFGFGNLSNLVSGVSHLTKFVENTGNKVITGGLDTLETIGKKTMEALQEGDPGLKNKRAFLKLDKDKPVLSQVLKEAKEKAEEENVALQKSSISRKLNFESLFDDYHGLVHLEALEMLSKQCDMKIQSLSTTYKGDNIKEILETLEQVRELCELSDEDDEDQYTLEDIEQKMEYALSEINVNITYHKCISTWKEAENWLTSLQLDICDDTEIHQKALQILAQLTAIAVEQFHKAGELLLIKEHRSTADEADSLVQLTTALTSLIGIAAGKFSEKLNAKSSGSSNKEKINDLITNIFFEAANSSSYIQDAFQLLIPVLQVGAI